MTCVFIARHTRNWFITIFKNNKQISVYSLAVFPTVKLVTFISDGFMGI